MNITELIERLQTTGDEAISTRQKRVIANALLAQQAVIEKMFGALDVIANSACGEESHQYIAATALDLQPDLSALREHDAELIKQFAADVEDCIYNGGNLETEARIYVERIRKGE